MSSCTPDIRLLLPKEGSSAIHLAQEVPTEITKTISLQIEDFLERLERLEGLEHEQTDSVDVFKSPTLLIGDHKVFVECWCHELNRLYVEVETDIAVLRSILVTGNCGNLAIEESGNDKDGYFFLSAEIGSLEELKRAMTSSGNHQLDLRVTVAVNVAVTENRDDNDEWIIPR